MHEEEGDDLATTGPCHYGYVRQHCVWISISPLILITLNASVALY